MKKILILSPYIPWPLRSGGNVGVFYMLSYIRKYMDVTFMTTYNKNNRQEYLTALQQELPEIKFKLYDYRQSEDKKYEYLRKFVNRVEAKMKFGKKADRLKLDTTEQLTPGFIKYINDYIEQENIDIVQIEFVSFLPFVYALPQNVKKIFIHHELGWIRNELTYGTDCYDQVIKAWLKDNEIAMLNHFDIVAPLTNVDAQKLKAEGCRAPIEVSTLAISDKTQPHVEQKFDGRLTFVGGSGHFPNYDGIQWFCKEILPLVRKQLPSIKMEIIGSWSEQHRNVIHEIDSSVVFRGFVDKLEDGIRNSVMVVPINIGSGMRMKIVEAANHSVPFVATVVGAEGLDFESGRDCYITDDPQLQADNIVKLCTDPLLYKRMSESIHKTFEEKYSFEALGNKRMNLY